MGAASGAVEPLGGALMLALTGLLAPLLPWCLSFAAGAMLYVAAGQLLSGLDSRLSVLELKYGTNVTGNSFEVTFGTLTGVVVTGVWNETYARIEF